MIPYIGSKSTLSDFILPNCPKNPEYWIESFGGMMGIYFTLNLKDYPDTKFVYNDINPLNYNLFNHLKKDEFIEKVISVNIDKTFYLECFDNLDSENGEIKALSWLVILICGELKNVMSKNYRGSSSFNIFKYKLPKYSEYYKRLQLENLDYKDLFKKYDDKNVFFYCDPPYRNYESFYTNHNFTDESHIELCSNLKNLKSSWILSYYEFTEMKEWYKDYKMVSKKHNLGTEYLILNNNI
jgi:site-specific DNA-adenine methylase